MKLYNTLTKKLEDFHPIDPGKVKLYTCGPTVYNHLHVGNWAAYIYWDTLVRTLILNNYEVERVMNITDVGHLVSDADDGEDKLEKGARREGKTAWEVAEHYTESFLDGMKKLGLVPPEHTVKATNFIDQQLDLLRKLHIKGFTYQISDGIYFDTSKFSTYTDFANLDTAAQKEGARVAANAEKRNSTDFALWKFSPEDKTRDMEWETPRDLLDNPTDNPKMGFPGWHLECSAMAMDLLGETIDIHTGGIDHIPVHHTNEIAQSEAASSKKFANYWLHNNHIKSDGTKISKSLQNGYTLDDLANHGYDSMDYRMFILQSHFQNEGNFSFDNLEAAHNRLVNWRGYAALRWQTHDTLNSDKVKSDPDKYISLLAVPGKVLEEVSNNLNTPAALSIVDEAFTRLDSTPLEKIHRHSLVQLIDFLDEIFGLQLSATTPDIDDEAKKLILERTRARDNKDWTMSDRARDELAKKGIAVRDTQYGTVWSYI